MNVHSHPSHPMPSLPIPTPAAEERSQEILASIRQAFAEKGFDGASMQDLARAAGMSVGNFYRYFPSKAAIVQSMCGMDMAEIQKDFTDVQGSDQPLLSLRDKLLSHFSEEALKDGQLWAEVTAASIRKPEICQVARQMEETITDFLAAVFASVTRRSHAEARERYKGQCQMLILLVKSVATRTAQFGPAGPGLTKQIVGIVDRILAEISSDVAEG
jgi:AcrR family transcriptional regulator